MENELIHVYFMPGMAASPQIFEFIKLPQQRFRLHYLEWMIPEIDESLEQYAKRMIEKIDEPNPVLIGVSFGGVLVQEMYKHLKVYKLIVISSIKTKNELPKRLKVLKIANAYKALPTSLVKNIELLSNFSLGETVSKRIKLYQKYLSVNHPRYLDWAIKEMIFWDQEEPIKDAIYIHGNKDIVFPHSCTGNCIIVKGGTHIMVINRFKWFNENLPKIINGSFNNKN